MTNSQWGIATTLLIATLSTGCASTSQGTGTSQTPSTCEEVPEGIWPGGTTVYRDCSVNRRAREVGQEPRLQYTPSRPPSGGQACLRAIFEMVVDSAGKPVTETARLVRTDDRDLAEAVQASLGRLRFEPARKDGKPVAQLVTVQRTVAFRAVTVVVPAGTPPSAAVPPSSSRPPRC